MVYIHVNHIYLCLGFTRNFSQNTGKNLELNEFIILLGSKKNSCSSAKGSISGHRRFMFDQNRMSKAIPLTLISCPFPRDWRVLIDQKPIKPETKKPRNMSKEKKYEQISKENAEYRKRQKKEGPMNIKYNSAETYKSFIRNEVDPRFKQKMLKQMFMRTNMKEM